MNSKKKKRVILGKIHERNETTLALIKHHGTRRWFWLGFDGLVFCFLFRTRLLGSGRDKTTFLPLGRVFQLSSEVILAVRQLQVPIHVRLVQFVALSVIRPRKIFPLTVSWPRPTEPNTRDVALVFPPGFNLRVQLPRNLSGGTNSHGHFGSTLI